MNMYVLHVEGAAGQHDTKQKEKKATRTTQSADLLGVQVSCHCVWFVGCLLYCLAEPPIETKLGRFTGFGRALLGKKKKKKKKKGFPSNLADGGIGLPGYRSAVDNMSVAVRRVELVGFKNELATNMDGVEAKASHACRSANSFLGCV